ncbi:MAG: hypothetical protein M3O34_06165 [Chloroflexota bacterium]|nr:hypothetical protein [Chloroflexota bacterium]
MSSQWEREIDELLRRREAKLRREPLSRKLSRRGGPFFAGTSGAFRSFLRRPPVEQFMIASLFLVALTFVLQMVPGTFAMARWLGILSLLLFVLALALSVGQRRGFGPREPKRWRDRDVSYGSQYPSLWDNLRTWFRRRR